MNLIHRRAALHGIALLLPFFITGFIVSLRLDPVYSWMDSLGLLTASPWLPTLLFLLLPVSVFVTIRPMLRRDNTCGKHPIYILNILLGALILGFTIFVGQGLAEDFIKCDILKIPNCD